jgi:hypothetical protein
MSPHMAAGFDGELTKLLCGKPRRVWLANHAYGLFC